jgi:hypothetical protein
MRAWWMHTKLNLGYLCTGHNAMCSLLFPVIDYTKDTLPATAQAVYCCVKWLRGIVKSRRLFLVSSTTILWYKDHSVNYVCSSHFSIICTLCHSSNILCEADSNPNFLLSEETTLYSRHIVNIFLYLALLCIQCTNLAGLLTLVLATWPCWRNSDYTIQHYRMKIKVWQIWIVFWLAFWC